MSMLANGQMVVAMVWASRRTVDGSIAENGQRAPRHATGSDAALSQDRDMKGPGWPDFRTDLASRPTPTAVSPITSVFQL